MEDVDLEAGGVVGAGSMRDAGWDYRGHAGTHDPDLPTEVELELPLDHHGDLLLFVSMDRGHRVRSEPDEVGHKLVPDHRAEQQAGNELHGRNVLIDLDVRASGGGPTLGIHREVTFSIGHRSLVSLTACRKRDARRRTPWGISWSSIRLKASRRLFRPRPSGKNGTPGTKATPSAIALLESSTASTPSGSVSQE